MPGQFARGLHHPTLEGIVVVAEHGAVEAAVGGDIVHRPASESQAGQAALSHHDLYMVYGPVLWLLWLIIQVYSTLTSRHQMNMISPTGF